MSYEVVAKLRVAADTKDIKKFNAALDELFKKANKKITNPFEQWGKAGADKLHIRLTGVANAENQLMRLVNLSKQVRDNLGGVKMPSIAGGNGGNRNGGNSWRGSTAGERLGWRAGAWGTYNALDRVGAGARGAGQGIAEGSSQRTLNKIILNDPKLQSQVEGESFKQSGQYRMVDASAMNEIGREAIGNLKNMADFPKAMAGVANTTQALALQYGDSKKGADAALKAYKAADVSGFADSAEQQKKFMDAYAKSSLMSGKDLSPELAKNAFRKMGALRLGLNEMGISEVVAATDEFQGDTGAVFRQFNRALTAGDVAKNRRASMRDTGLRDSNDNAVDATLLKTNPFDWVEKHIAPKMQKAGIDLSDITAESASRIEQELNKMGLMGEGQKFATYALTKRDEILNRRKKIAGMDFKEDTVKNLPDSDIRSANAAFGSQMKNAADSFTKSIQPVYTGLLSGLSKITHGLAAESDKNPTQSVAGLGIGAVALAGGFFMKDGMEGVNNKLTVSNALLGKIVLSSAAPSLGGVGGAAGKVGAGAAMLGGLQVAAVAAVAYGAYNLIKTAEGKRNERVENDPVEKYREDLTALDQSQYDMNGIKLFDHSAEIAALKAKILSMEVNAPSRADPTVNKGIYDGAGENSILDQIQKNLEATEAKTRINKNLIGDGMAKDDYGNPLYKDGHEPNKYDQDGGTPVDNSGKLGFMDEGKRFITGVSADIAKIGTAAVGAGQAAQQFGTNAIESFSSMLGSLSAFVAKAKELENIKIPTGGVATGSLNTGVSRPGGGV